MLHNMVLLKLQLNFLHSMHGWPPNIKMSWSHDMPKVAFILRFFFLLIMHKVTRLVNHTIPGDRNMVGNEIT